MSLSVLQPIQQNIILMSQKLNFLLLFLTQQILCFKTIAHLHMKWFKMLNLSLHFPIALTLKLKELTFHFVVFVLQLSLLIISLKLKLLSQLEQSIIVLRL